MTSIRRPWTGLATLTLVLFFRPPIRADEVRLLPASVRLVGPQARQRFIVEQWDGRTWVGDKSSAASYSVDNARVSRVSPQGVVTPLGNGLATLTATIGG